MDSYDDQPGRPGPLTSSTPHVVVECPSCKTKFAVESIAIASIENPKFHCSRCDAVFSLKTAHDHSNGHPAIAAQPSRPVVAPEPPVQAPQPQRAISFTPDDVSVAPRAQFDPTAAREQSDGAVRSSFQPQEARNTETKTAESRVTAATPPHFPRSASSPAPVKASDFSLGFDRPASSEPVATSVEPTASADSTVVPSPPALSVESRQTPEMRSEKAEKPAVATFAPLTMTSKQEPPVVKRPAPVGDGVPKGAVPLEPIVRYTDRRPLFGALGSQVHSLVLMTTPLVACLALLLVLSYSLRVSPQSFGGLITQVIPSLVGPAAPQLPPAQLTVRAAGLQFVTLQTKEVIPVVAGTLVNDTGETIDGVTLEGLGFNERGEILLSSRAPLRSALAREKISELSLDNVRKFQLSLSARHSSIAPGEEVPFSIALIANRDDESGAGFADIDLSKLKYFSARVFSVR